MLDNDPSIEGKNYSHMLPVVLQAIKSQIWQEPHLHTVHIGIARLVADQDYNIMYMILNKRT
jgi:hypothetical protein